jgi:hypothetical protein
MNILWFDLDKNIPWHVPWLLDLYSRPCKSYWWLFEDMTPISGKSPVITRPQGLT